MGGQDRTRRATVLVVEDDSLCGHALARLAQHYGFDAEAPALSLAAGLEALDRLSAAKTLPAFILLDLVLPDGDGTEVLRRVRQRKLPCRVAVLTARSAPHELSECRSLKPDLLLIKPYQPEVLFQWMQRELPPAFALRAGSSAPVVAAAAAPRGN